jgi:hypothetical protein
MNDDRNNDTGDGRGWRRRAGSRRAVVLAAALAGLTVLAAGCGGGRSSAAAGSTPYQHALVYAQCMRSHGEPGFPDPNNQGLFQNLGPVNSNSPQYLSATKACGHLLPTFQESADQRRQDLSTALKFSACMRSHGIVGYRDPTELPNGNIERGGNPGPGSSPQLQAAATACRQFEPVGAP